jgi:putative transposase
MANKIIEGDIELEAMSTQNHFPEKCLACAKSSKPLIPAGCRSCQDLSFQEEVLCDLNRSTQDPVFFECHAFQPSLKLVASSGQETRMEPKAHSVGITSERLLDSDRVKYQRALALQKLARNPDDIIFDIKYHFVWNVIGRRPAFAAPESMIDYIGNVIATCGEAVGGFANLYWLAPDHIHLYVESDGEVSPDNMAQELKRNSEVAILERFPELIESPEVETGLWDEAYFVETVG